jgi:uncharacterized coiled-coil DUF342 family protein
MILPTQIWYRDAAAERAHLREVNDRWKEYKDLKKKLDKAKEKADEARREADETADRAKDAKEKADEACEKAKKAREEAEEARRQAGQAQSEADQMAVEAGNAAEAAQSMDAEADAERRKVADCKDCLAEVRRTQQRIKDLRSRYENLRSGSALSGPRSRLGDLDIRGAWDSWWDSFKRFRDEAKALTEVKNFTDVDLPDEFTGIWDWGGPVGTAVGYGAEDLANAPIPTDAIKAVGGLYAVFQAALDPKTALGSRILALQLGTMEAAAAAQAFKVFPRVLRNAIKSFEKLQRLVELEGNISDALDKWKDCLSKLPEAPADPSVDMDSLCYEQCLDKLEELRAHEAKLRKLIRQAEDCEPEGMEDMFKEANQLKGQLNGMKRQMDRTRKGLAEYRRAMRQHFGTD